MARFMAALYLLFFRRRRPEEKSPLQRGNHGASQMPLAFNRLRRAPQITPLLMLCKIIGGSDRSKASSGDDPWLAAMVIGFADENVGWLPTLIQIVMRRSPA